MGRHSAPDDEEDGDVLVASAVAVEALRRGRHALPDDQEAAAPADEPTTDLAAEPTVEVAREATTDLVTDDSVQRLVPLPGKGNQSTAADLELLRAHSDVRARVIAAVVAPFVIYTLAMYLGSTLDVYFIWIWVPLVTAGVLAGSILDAAHRRQGSRGG
jgi:hypothetical protein